MKTHEYTRIAELGASSRRAASFADETSSLVEPSQPPAAAAKSRSSSGLAAFAGAMLQALGEAGAAMAHVDLRQFREGDASKLGQVAAGKTAMLGGHGLAEQLPPTSVEQQASHNVGSAFTALADAVAAGALGEIAAKRK